jgi:outer membrane receptor for ferrienterochelin and colicins
MSSILARLPRLAAVLVWLVLPGFASAQTTAEASRAISLDSLLNTRISAASKYAQTSGEAPASVTILTSDDIERFGYGRLEELIESVRGFYMSNDRNYSYLGTRGFSRPSDYSNRVLMLIDGHSMNDQTWGAAPMGRDLPINLAAVERIEVVRGPGAALYGTSAMFAVINIVTKAADALNGTAARMEIGSLGERTIGMTSGHEFGSGISITGSGLLTNTKGADQYYPEYDTPATNNGIAHALDWEHGVSALGKLTWSDLTVQTGYRTYSKGIPTGQFGLLFNDPRTQAFSESMWGDVALQHEWNGSLNLSARLYTDRTHSVRTYPLVEGLAPFTDDGKSSATGAELMLGWEPTSRVRLTLGTEDNFITTASYASPNLVGVETSDNAPYHVLSAFAQSELQLLPSVMLVAGARMDRYSTVGNATTPRLALIVTPTGGTTVKLLYGEAFRAPSANQALLTAGVFVANPGLAPERIATTEVDVQQRFGSAVLAGVSAYRYLLENLIDQSVESFAVVKFVNLSSVEARGLEFYMELRPAEPVVAQLSYVLQGGANGQDSALTNSPHQIANLGVTAHAADGLRGAVQLRYESGRRTLASTTSPFLRTDTNVGYRPGPQSPLSRFANAEIGLRVTNLFDTAYATPAGDGSRQDAIAANGRTVALHLEWHF